MDVRLIAVTDEPIARWADVTEVALGETGERCVKGLVVTERYFAETPPRRSRRSRTATRSGTAWATSRGWTKTGASGSAGGKSQRVVLDDMTLFTVPCEAVFNTHPKVFRSALVGVTIGGVKRPPSAWAEAAHRR